MVGTGALQPQTQTRRRAPVDLGNTAGGPPADVDEAAFAQLPADQQREVIEQLANR